MYCQYIGVVLDEDFQDIFHIHDFDELSDFKQRMRIIAYWQFRLLTFVHLTNSPKHCRFADDFMKTLFHLEIDFL